MHRMTIKHSLNLQEHTALGAKDIRRTLQLIIALPSGGR